MPTMPQPASASWGISFYVATLPFLRTNVHKKLLMKSATFIPSTVLPSSE